MRHGFRERTFLSKLVCPEVCSPAAMIETGVKIISPLIQKSQLSGRSPVPTRLMKPPGESSGGR